MQGNGRNSDLLDRAMRDLLPEQRARALDLVVQLGIDRDDPLWLICLAIGQLQVLVTDAPQEWRKTFENFSTDLEQWTATNLKALEAISNQAEASADLAEISQKLTSTLSVLAKQLSEQNRQPQQLKKGMSDLKRSLETLSQEMDSIKTSLKTLTSDGNMRNISTESTKTNNGVFLGKWLLLGLLVLNGVSVMLLWAGLQNNSQQFQWLLFKTTRIECKQGIVPKSASQCKQFR